MVNKMRGYSYYHYTHKSIICTSTHILGHVSCIEINLDLTNSKDFQVTAGSISCRQLLCTCIGYDLRL